MDEVEMRQVVAWFRDVLRLIVEGKPVPTEFLQKQIQEWEAKLQPKPLTPLHSELL